MTLNPAQLQAIDSHLRKENWLINEELIAELTDHYASGIAERTERGMPFGQALREVHDGFGGRQGLLNMEETYQSHRAKRLERLVWTGFQSYFRTNKLLPAVLFAVFYGINGYTQWSEEVHAFLLVGIFNLLIGVLASLVGWVVLARRNGGSFLVDQPVNWFNAANLGAYVLYVIYHYFLTALGGSSPPVVEAAIMAWVEMSAVLYMLATITALRTVLKKPIPSSTKNG
ncbi:hypothetical protein ACFQ4C_14080 [Larkinella insperata]|uniref:DUF1700 domain-containing protein n=1 Tax=Larkinella insperata TaxID=332158 RepID=A0ABW3QML7_9BACT|nr:hypothetical protein [Larkinella insperata]